MLFLFRTNQVVFNLFLLLYLLVLRISYFLNPVRIETPTEGVLANFLQATIGDNVLVEGVFLILLLFIQAVLINNLAAKRRIFNETTLLPGLFYILLMNILQDFYPLSAILIGNMFLIIAIDELMSTYKRSKCADTIFNTGFWIGIASLCYSSFGLFLFLIFLGLPILRAFRLKEQLMLLSGFLVPFLFSSAWFYWQDGLAVYWQSLRTEQFSFLDFGYINNRVFLIKLVAVAVCFLLGFFNGYPFNKSIQTRNYVKIIYLALFISGLTFLFQPNVTILHFLIVMVPLSLLLTARFLAFNSNVAEVVHTLLLIGVLFFQFRGFEELFG